MPSQERMDIYRKWGGKDDSGWPGDYMEYDQTNTGWYYKDFSVNAVQKHTQHGATGDRKIKPGETLIMFSNNYNNSVGYSVHRCPQHLEPGIPLFDYEDCEGWIVYDPTSDPTWNIYDAMPTIENIKFTIYTKFQTYGWFKVYGVAHENNGKREQFTIFDKNGKSWSCTNAGNGWYETVITLKTVKGDHEKDIRIMKDKKSLTTNPFSFSMATAMRSIMTQAITMAPLGTLASHMVWIK